MTGILIRRGKNTETHTGRKPCEDGGRDWSDAANSQGTPRIASNHQKLEEAREDASPGPLERARPCRYLDLGLLAFRAVRE